MLAPLRDEWALSPNNAAGLTVAVQFGWVAEAMMCSRFNIVGINSPRHVIMGGGIGAAIGSFQLPNANVPVAGIPLRCVDAPLLWQAYSVTDLI